MKKNKTSKAKSTRIKEVNTQNVVLHDIPSQNPRRRKLLAEDGELPKNVVLHDILELNSTEHGIARAGVAESKETRVARHSQREQNHIARHLQLKSIYTRSISEANHRFYIDLILGFLMFFPVPLIHAAWRNVQLHFQLLQNFVCSI